MVTNEIAPPPETSLRKLQIPNNKYQSERSAREVLNELQNFNTEEIDMVYVLVQKNGVISFTVTKEENPELLEKITNQIYGGEVKYKKLSYFSSMLEPEDYDYYFIFYNDKTEQLSLVFLANTGEYTTPESIDEETYERMYENYNETGQTQSTWSFPTLTLICDGHYFTGSAKYNFTEIDEICAKISRDCQEGKRNGTREHIP